jgi:hypothetical protein
MAKTHFPLTLKSIISYPSVTPMEELHKLEVAMEKARSWSSFAMMTREVHHKRAFEE